MSMTPGKNADMPLVGTGTGAERLLERSLLAAIGRAWTSLVTYLERRKDENDLMALDDRMLKDIGLDRAGITWAVMTAERDQGGRVRSRPPS